MPNVTSPDVGLSNCGVPALASRALRLVTFRLSASRRFQLWMSSADIDGHQRRISSMLRDSIDAAKLCSSWRTSPAAAASLNVGAAGVVSRAVTVGTRGGTTGALYCGAACCVVACEVG